MSISEIASSLPSLPANAAPEPSPGGVPPESSSGDATSEAATDNAAPGHPPEITMSERVTETAAPEIPTQTAAPELLRTASGDTLAPASEDEAPVPCYRCTTTFPSQGAYELHRYNAQNHWKCKVCEFDGISAEHYMQHCRRKRCAIACQGCHRGWGAVWPKGRVWEAAYKRHVGRYHVCVFCDIHFKSPEGLFRHKEMHCDEEETVLCIMCNWGFRNYSSMIKHLEYHKCSGVDDLIINICAARSPYWHDYIDSQYRNDMLQGVDLRLTDGDVDPYVCPECEEVFPFLSQLFAHIESNGCDQGMEDDSICSLQEYLWQHLRFVCPNADAEKYANGENGEVGGVGENGEVGHGHACHGHTNGEHGRTGAVGVDWVYWSGDYYC